MDVGFILGLIVVVLVLLAIPMSRILRLSVRSADMELRIVDCRTAESKPLTTEPPYPVRFHALWPQYTWLAEWETMLVYVLSGRRGLEGACADFRRRKTVPPEGYADSSSISTEQIRRGTQIRILPQLEGFRFNPEVGNILWLEDWHCVEFRMQALAEASPPQGQRIDGSVSFYVGPLLIAETQLFVEIRDELPEGGPRRRHDEPSRIPSPFLTEESSSAYRAIFVSYSHRDSYIVDQLQKAYRALGDDYLRDVEILRSGEEWSPALLG